MVQWNVATRPLAKIFWSILVMEIIGFGVMMILAARTGGHTPEGPVGAWLIFLPPLIWARLMVAVGTRCGLERRTGIRRAAPSDADEGTGIQQTRGSRRVTESTGQIRRIG